MVFGVIYYLELHHTAISYYKFHFFLLIKIK